MKLLFLRLFMLISCGISLISCNSATRTKDASGDIKTRLPMPVEGGEYSLQITELLGVDYLYNLGGKFARFYTSPRVSNGHITGAAPRTRFIQSGDLYVAADSMSLQLATVYAHTQKLATLDRELGVGEVNKWPRDIGVAVRPAGGIRNNAFYDGDMDAMLFVPYVGENLPLAVNAGILAHEHFHSLFYKLVTIPLNEAGKNPQKISAHAHTREHDEIYKELDMPILHPTADGEQLSEQAAYHILLMRGLNEGLADFWGWLYTGDADFIAYSLPNEKNIRSLKTQGTTRRLMLFNQDTLRNRVGVLAMNQKYLLANINNEAYTLGTQYSRILKIFTDTTARSRGISSAEARKLIAKQILKTLGQLKTDLLQLGANDFYDPAQFLKAFYASAEGANQEECEIVAEALSRNQGRILYSCAQKGTQWEIQSTQVPLPDVTKVVPSPEVPGVSFLE